MCREGKEYDSWEGKTLSFSMLPAKPKHRCIYLSFQNVCCDKDPVKGNKYCAEHINPNCICIYTAYDVPCDKNAAEGKEHCDEHIEPQCAFITLSIGRQCKNKVYVPGEIHCKQCKKEEEKEEEERKIERMKEK